MRLYYFAISPFSTMETANKDGFSLPQLQKGRYHLPTIQRHPQYVAQWGSDMDRTGGQL